MNAVNTTIHLKTENME